MATAKNKKKTAAKKITKPEVSETPKVEEVSETPEVEEVEEIAETPAPRVVEAPTVPKAAASLPKSNILDILVAHQMSTNSFYQKNYKGIAPKRPISPEQLSADIGVPGSAEILRKWNNNMVLRLRPRRGFPLPVVESPQQILKLIESL